MLTLTAEQVRTLAPDASAARAAEALASPRRWTAAGGPTRLPGASVKAVVRRRTRWRWTSPARPTVLLPVAQDPCKHALGLLFLVADGGHHRPSHLTGCSHGWTAAPVERPRRPPGRNARRDRPRSARQTRRIARTEGGGGHRRARPVAARPDAAWPRQHAQRGLPLLGRDGRPARGCPGGRTWPIGARVGRQRTPATPGRTCCSKVPDACTCCRGVPPVRSAPRGLEGRRPLARRLEREGGRARSVKRGDRWLVIGQRIDDRGDIVTARTFLLGETSARIGLHLAFGVGAAPPTLLAVPGQAFRATVTFYPSATPLRVAVQPRSSPTAKHGHPSLDHAGCGRRGTRRTPRAKPVRWCLACPHWRRRARRAGRPAPRAGRGRDRAAGRGRRRRTAPARHLGRPSDPPGRRMGWRWLRPLAAFADGRLASVTADADTIEVKIDDPDWSALVSAALLGTERTGGNAPIPTAVAGLVVGADTEQAILAAAASMAVRRGRAGRRRSTKRPPAPGRTRPASPTCRPAGAIRRAGVRGATVLAPEVLELVRRTGRRLPDEWLPGSWHSRTDRRRDTALVDLGGARAAWLAGCFPELAGDASWGMGEDWEEAWAATASGAARAALVRQFRERDLPAPDNSWRTVGRTSRPRSELASSLLSRQPSTRPTRPSFPSDSRIGGRTSGVPPWASWSSFRSRR